MNPDAYAEQVEKQVEKICGQVRGAGTVDAVVTLKGGYRAVYATDSQSSASGYKNNMVLVGSGSSEGAVLICYENPELSGIGIVCAGGNDPVVRERILSLVCATFNIPSNKVYEDDLCFAFYDIAPQAPTHFLVIPKAHIASVSEVNADNSAVVAHIFEVIAKLSEELGMESYRVVSNIGEQAGQTVFHMHFHVLSGRDMTWPPG